MNSPRIPPSIPKVVLTKHAAPPPPKPEKPRADQFDRSTGTQSTTGRLSARASWAQLPDDLKSKVSEQAWKALPEGQRGTLISMYQGFKRAGVWDDVTEVLGEKEQREPPVSLPGGYQTHVAGNSGALAFRVRDAAEFTKKLTVLNPNFGVDGGVMGALHAGQTSIRQSDDTTSLHVSVGPGNLADAHVDRVNPVDTPENGRTKMNVLRGIQHWSQEVLPEKLRDAVGIPGLIISPELKPGSRDGKPEGRITVNVEFHGIEKQKRPLPVEPMEGSPSVPDGVMEKVAARLKDSGMVFPVPKGVSAGEAPEPAEVAAAIAAKMKEAVEKGDSRVRLDLPIYAGLKNLQDPVLGDLRRIADVVRSEMQAAGVDVSGVQALTVTFGRPTEGGTVSILHNGE